MDVTREPASAAAGASRSFPADLVLTTLFDCPLWPSAEMDPNLLVSFMTGVNKRTHTFPARMLSCQSLAQQFPAVLEDFGAHMASQTLCRSLGHQAQVRRDELAQWLQEIALSGQIALNADAQFTELLYVLADELDWFLRAQPNRSAALTLWFRRVARSHIKALAQLPRSTVSAALPKLDEIYRHREEDALQIHRIWLQTRRVVAGLSAEVTVTALPVGTYTEPQAEDLESEESKDYCASRFTWGRLEHFRLQTQQKPSN